MGGAVFLDFSCLKNADFLLRGFCVFKMESGEEADRFFKDKTRRSACFDETEGRLIRSH
jgi:hypothetical protein